MTTNVPTRASGPARPEASALRIAIYPETAKVGLRLETLRAFATALAHTPHQVDWVEDKTYSPCDVAILYGAPGIGEGRRRQIRQKILNEHKGPVLIVETPLFGRKVPAIAAAAGGLLKGGLPHFLAKAPAESFGHFRISIGGSFHDTGQFCNEPTDPLRWDRLAAELGLTVKPWRATGEHILLIGQVPGDASLRGLDVVKWLESTVIDLRLITRRPILIRPHPLSPPAALRSLKRRLKPDKSVRWDMKPGTPLRSSLSAAWATVTYSSSAAIDSLISGVPVIALSPASLAWPVSDHGISDVLEPTLYDRKPWLDRLAHSQWSIEEIENGTVWRRFAGKIGELVAGR
ncbi:hypothetical protein [Taklimakanibacter deserti]|uniref:hypothetical protein n=1 Tax=Taklimakanibacter deserti TaxID=2267839 RepID=UPI0013C51CE7